MDAPALLAVLRQRGVTLEAKDGRLLFRPKDRAADLVAAIRALKPDLLRLLSGNETTGEEREEREQSPPPPPLSSLCSLSSHPVASPNAGWDWLVQMPADRFGAGRYVVWLHSEILGERVALVSSAALVPRVQAKGYVAYTPNEIDCLAEARPDPDTLRKLHAVKKGLGTTLTGSVPADGCAGAHEPSTGEQREEREQSPPPCPCCACRRRWRTRESPWVCAKCHPPAPGLEGVEWEG